MLTLLNLKTLVRDGLSGTLAAVAALTATARYWLNPASDFAAVHLVRYILITYWLEILVVLLMAAALLLPSQAKTSLGRCWTRIVASHRVDVRGLSFTETRTRSALRLGSGALVIAAALLVTQQTLPHAIDFARTKIALLVSYSKIDFLRFLCQEASDRLIRLDYNGAEAYYRSALGFFGENETIASELEKLPRFRAYGMRWVARAEELEATIGPNRHSLYLYVDALPFTPQAQGILYHIETYIPLLDKAQQIDDSILSFCAPTYAERKNGLVIDRDMVTALRGLATSAYARDTLAILAAPTSPQELLIHSNNACEYRLRFGPLVHTLKDDRERLTEVLDTIKQKKSS